MDHAVTRTPTVLVSPDGLQREVLSPPDAFDQLPLLDTAVGDDEVLFMTFGEIFRIPLDG